ncbi:DUF58 domain-containing protein [Paenibacillus endoradicis]|uniref:DUF58 domain-containing protein n=1 Tax=Paenibacillus endoradicis TaxID=2972487 RepID=UPI0021593919|nr:DUF58 domain-containing protein [Paenibacillus endoradicis]MCR8656354.1 DUF58 domain-containing protein [Paenibacillus endoradicis]
MSNSLQSNNSQQQDAMQLLQLLFPDQSWLSKLDQMMIRSNSRVKGMLAGKRRSSQLGSSLEFADYRPYVSGDDVRRIDWNLYGRTSKAYIRQYWDEQERSFNLYVDSSKSMSSFGRGDTNKWLFALRFAASIGYLSLICEDRVQINLFNELEVVDSVPSLYGKHAKFTLIKHLGQLIHHYRSEDGHSIGNIIGRKREGLNEDMNPSRSDIDMQADWSDMMRAFQSGASLPRRAGVTWLFSDGLYDEGLENLLSQLQARGQEVVFVHILHAEEWNPQLEGELKLIDIETNRNTEVAITPAILTKYEQGVAQFQLTLKQLCESRGIAYYCMNSGQPFTEQFIGLLSSGETIIYK